ncbi:MAG: 23S rRNA (guanosine(2251)-2'-O)-methyltransferase RlmB [Pseudomonadales bacterium]|nr:23S rRNA (guanosine(2251)-2'-O)-methyltransferase RlmB [Pseudomonadales bacterium]
MSSQRIFGINAVTARLGLGKAEIEKILIKKGELSSRLNDLLLLAEQTGCFIERVSDEALDEMTSITHQGVGLLLHSPKVKNEHFLYELLEQEKANQKKEPLLLLVLDGVTDPRNLGACLRSAATLGVHAVIVPKDNSAPLNDAAMKTASGGASYVPLIQVVNLARCLTQLKKAGVWIVGTLLEDSQNITAVDLKGHIAIVMGSEEKGMRHKTTKCCDFLVNIPMQNENFGFNVSVATGICLYEVQRQRRATI